MLDKFILFNDYSKSEKNTGRIEIPADGSR